MKNIHKNGNKYRIMKYINGEYYDFGSYPSQEIAVYLRDMLQENDWKIPFQSTTIFELDDKYHVIVNTFHDKKSKANIRYLGEAATMDEAQKIAANPLGEKYMNSNGWGYNLEKTINNKKVSFGFFRDHEIAYDMRDYIVLCGWELPTHKDEYMIHLNGKTYLLRIRDGKIRVMSVVRGGQIRNVSSNMENIYQQKNGYSISRLVGKKRYNYRTYQTLDEAKSMRKFLREHDWNMELFEEEYNKRYPPLPEYVYFNDGKYVVKRFWKGIHKNYGRYNTLQEAVSRVEYLEKHNWQTKQNGNIVNYDGTFMIYKNVNNGVCTPFRKFYFASESRDEAEEMLERYKVEGFPEPFLVTNRYRYIIRNRQVYYVFYKQKKLCLTRSLRDAFVARDLCELLGMIPLVPGEYVLDNVRYEVSLNPWGTPVFVRA